MHKTEQRDAKQVCKATAASRSRSSCLLSVSFLRFLSTISLGDRHADADQHSDEYDTFFASYLCLLNANALQVFFSSDTRAGFRFDTYDDRYLSFGS